MVEDRRRNDRANYLQSLFGKDTKQVDYAEVCQNTQDLDWESGFILSDIMERFQIFVSMYRGDNKRSKGSVMVWAYISASGVRDL